MAATTPARSTPTTFGARVREARLELGLSQAELARQLRARTKTKIHKALISQWELGRVNNPQLATLEALVAVTGYTHTWLATGRGPKKISLDKALADDQASKALDRSAFKRAVSSVVSQGVTQPARAAEAALVVYDTLVESPTTDDAVLNRMIRLVPNT